MAFDAFVSYSHAADGRLAPALQRAMQRLAKPWYRARALRVFRDETALSANPHLWSSIQTAMDESEWFVLLASPDAAASEWVNRELDYWLASKSTDRILVAVTDGTWRWDPAAHAVVGTAVPTALGEIFDEEPRHVDLRWARTTTDLDLRNSRFRDVVAQLAAPAHGIAKDELESEDVRLYRHARRLARGATSVLVLLMVISLVLGGFAWQQRSNAQRQTARAEREANATLGEALAAQALDAAHNNRSDLALLLAVEAYHLRPRPDERRSLLSVLVDQPTLQRQLYGLTDTAAALAFSPDGRMLAAASESGQLRIWDIGSGRPLAHQPKVSASTPDRTAFSSSTAKIGFADNGRLLVVSADGAGRDVRRRVASVVDVATGRVLLSVPDVSPSGGGWAVSANAPVFAGVDASGSIEVRDLRSDRRIALITTRSSPGRLALSPDASSVAMAHDWSGDAHVWTVANGRPVGPGCTAAAGSTLRASTTGTTPAPPDPTLNIAVLSDDVTVRTWGATGEGTAGSINTCRADRGQDSQAILAPPGVTPAPNTQLSSLPGEFAGLTSDGDTVASRNGDGTIQLVDLKSGAQIGLPVRAPLVIHLDPLVTATVAFSPDGRHMSAIEQNGNVHVWQTTDALWRASAAALDRGPSGPQSRPVVFQDRAGRIAVTYSGTVIDMRTGQPLAHIPDAYRAGGFSNLVFDWPLLAFAVPHKLVVLDLERHMTRDLAIDNGPVGQIVTAGHDGLTCSNGAGNPALTGTAAISAVNRILLIVCNDVIEPIDISSWPWQPAKHPISTTVGANANMISFSPDERTLALLGDAGLQLFAINGMHLQARRTYPTIASAWAGMYGAMAFTADSRTLVWARSGGLVELIRVKQPTLPSTTLAQPDGQLPTDAAVSRDGSLLAVTEGAGIRIWDLLAYELVGIIPEPRADAGLFGSTVSLTSRAATVATSPDPSGARSIFRFDFDPTSWQRRACTVANRNLTQAEWAQYLPGIAYRKTCPDLP